MAPHVEFSTNVKAPDKPHLAVMTGNGTATAIPIGATMLVIEDPTRADKITPLILLKVSAKTIDFACACMRPGCTRKLRYRVERSGYHPSTTESRHTAAFGKDG